MSEKRYTDEDMRQYLLDMRGLDKENLCSCNGTGVKLYGSTSTYFGGIGGQAMTLGVCNRCWGSGDRNNKWPSHLEYFRMKRLLDK